MGIIKGIIKAPFKVAMAPVKVAKWGAETAVDTAIIGGTAMCGRPDVAVGLVVGKAIGKNIKKQNEKDKKKAVEKALKEQQKAVKKALKKCR
jgi:hypothetical protein